MTTAKIISRSATSFKMQIDVPYANSMLEGEELLQASINELGQVGTGELLEQFDADGSPIKVGGSVFTAKTEKLPKVYETPYGEVTVERFVYQGSQGGKSYVPLETKARIISSATPKFAKIVTSKYSCDGAPGVQRDLKENHQRTIAVSYIKNLTDYVGTIAEAKEETWKYALPEMPEAVKSISLSLDGTCVNMKADGWREAMCGTVAFYDKEGNRMHTTYTAASPEYGKERFLGRLTREIERAKETFPKAKVVGLADGAHCNWDFLAEHADVQTLDFWHLSEYIAQAAQVLYRGKSAAATTARAEWLEEACHKAKHVTGGVARIATELKKHKAKKSTPKEGKEKLGTVLTYIENNKERTKYPKNVAENLPIGSGVIEAACKTLVKNRMCLGAARWSSSSADVVLSLRAMHQTPGRWHQFWTKYSQFGHCQAA